MTGGGNRICGGVYSCAPRSPATASKEMQGFTDSQEEDETTCGNNSGNDPQQDQERRPSLDLSALERKTVRGGITRFHCRYFLKPRSSEHHKHQQQQQQPPPQQQGQSEQQQEQQEGEEGGKDEAPEQKSNSLTGPRRFVRQGRA